MAMIDPPDWKAGEWHALTATWSASANQMAIYTDCVLAGQGAFPALAGSAGHFHLGSGDAWGVMDAAFDDIVFSRRALAVNEVEAACKRGGPAPNDEVTFPTGETPLAVGEQVAFELTPCDTTGACGAASITSQVVSEPPLGALAPATGLLPAGTTWIDRYSPP